MHSPKAQLVLGLHTAHASPRCPQARLEVPVSHRPSEVQQPATQVVAEHFGAHDMKTWDARSTAVTARIRDMGSPYQAVTPRKCRKRTLFGGSGDNHPMSTITNRTRYQAFTGQLSETNGLAFGHKGPKVMEMQKMLKAAGFDPGPLDGKFGPLTQAALKSYQRSTGAATDGTLELSEYKRLAGNYEKITSEGFDERAAGVNLTGGVDMPVQSSGAQGPGTAQRDAAPRAPAERRPLRLRGRGAPRRPEPRHLRLLGARAVGGAPGGRQHHRRVTEPAPRHRAHRVAQAARTPGALLFNGHHVAISLGDGVHTIEAMGSRYGVRIGTIGNRFEDGGLVRGLQY